MNEFSRFYVEFYKYIWQDLVFFFREAVWTNTIVRFFENLKSYYDLLLIESVNFTVVAWVMVVATFVLNISLIIFVIVKLYLWFRKFASFRAIEIEKNELIEEIAMLNEKVLELADEKNQILALKVSQLGINAKTQKSETPVFAEGSGQMQPAYEGGLGTARGPGGMPFIPTVIGGGGGGVSGSAQNQQQPDNGVSRFVKLINVDKEYAGKDSHIYMEEQDYLSLPEIVTSFVNFSCSKLKLYYTPKMISYFFSGMAASKVMILEGISGTGKTSLPYAMAKFFGNNASIISVQPSWRE